MHPDYAEMRRLRDKGMKLRKIGDRFGMNDMTVLKILGFPDPRGPFALDSELPYVPYETPEQRAFRRFPINAHKPGGFNA